MSNQPECPLPGFFTAALRLPDGRLAPLFGEGVAELFDQLPPETRNPAIDTMKEFLEKAKQLPQGANEESMEYRVREMYVDGISWQLSKCLRYSKPGRIQEAVEPLTFVIESHKKHHGGALTEATPTLYLCSALSRVGGEEERADKLFAEALGAAGHDSPWKTLLWTRANMARMYRRINKIKKAQVQEKAVRDWIIGHPFACSPSDLRGTIEDDIGTGAHIFDHDDVKKHLSRFQEISPGVAIFSG